MRACAWIALVIVACDAPAAPDASTLDAGRAVCAGDSDCDDGRFCNGSERCDPQGAGGDAFGCVAAESPCMAAQTCDEVAATCTTACDVTLDADGDGHDALECGGDDCDDADADRFPGNAEVCDLLHHDEDCDPATFGLVNEDRDGFPSSECCNRDAGGALRCGSDCDDTRPEINPEASEECDGLDNDCDGRVDEGLPQRDYHPDCDGDMFGAAGTSAIRGCRPPPAPPFGCGGAATARWAENASDCDDTAAGVNPGATDVCNGIDDDCDGVLEGVGEDLDGDGFGGPGCGGGADCDDGDPSIHPHAVERCNGIDDDCDGAPSIGEDADGDGYLGVGASCVGGPLGMLPRLDCDDRDPSISPDAAELCDGVDRDCDGSVDEEPAASASCARDHAVTSCASPACVLDACAGAYADCNGALADGCEIDTDGALAHCGSCGNACFVHCLRGGCNDPRAIVAGGTHTCVLLASGATACFGDNASGQLGDGTTSAATSAVLVATSLSAAAIALGSSHGCMLEASGRVSCWGEGIFGQLGDGSTSARSLPAPVTGLSDAVRLHGGASHTCAVRADGSLACWGWNINGQLGDGTTVNRTTFVTVPGVTSPVSVALGVWHTCAVTPAGAVTCWGGNGRGQLGDGTTTRRLSPITVPGITDAVAVAAGAEHTCVLRTGGAVTCWGDGLEGELGHGVEEWRTTPVMVSGLTDAIAIAAGGNQTCAIRASGQALCWGGNFYGQVGDGTTMDRAVPTQVLGLGDAAAITANGSHACALRAGGEPICWGHGSAVGDGTTLDRHAPVRIAPL